MSATNSAKPTKKSILQTDLGDINLSRLIPRHEPKQLASSVMMLLTGLSLLVSLIFIIITGININRTDIPPQEGQLLNRGSVEKAAQLLTEETVLFDSAE